MRNNLLAAICFIALISPVAAHESTDLSSGIQAEIEECFNDPRFAPGGAMIGDCLLAKSSLVEPEIDATLHRVSKRYCRQETRDNLHRAQSLWQEYRKHYCGLVENSPGNTPSFVNGAACHLQLTQQRVEALSILDEAAYERCLSLSFLAGASVFGEPQTPVRKEIAPGLIWAVSAAGNEIVIERDGKAPAQVNIQRCSYCTDGTACSEGTFVFEYPSATTGDGRPGFDYALLHACRVDDDIRFQLVSNLLTAPRANLSGQGYSTFDWKVDGDRLIVSGAGQDDLNWLPSSRE